MDDLDTFIDSLGIEIFTEAMFQKELEMIDDERAPEIQRMWNRLDGLGDLDDGWLEGDGRSPDADVIARAKEVLARLLVEHREVPQAGRISHAEWRNPGRMGHRPLGCGNLFRLWRHRSDRRSQQRGYRRRARRGFFRWSGKRGLLDCAQ